MDPARAVREARQAAGLSQRALARFAGVAERTVASAESGSRDPSLSSLQAMLSACGLELVVQPTSEPAAPDTHLREHLSRSLTDRFVLATRATGRHDEILAAVQALSWTFHLVLDPADSITLWVPGASLSLPLVVSAHPDWPGAGSPAHLPQIDPAVLVARLSTRPLETGLVAVRLPGWSRVHVRHAAALATDPCCRAWQPALSAAALLLHAEAGRDAADRRAPPHRQPDEDEEARRLGHALRYAVLARSRRPSALNGRALRLDAPVSLPQWLEREGLPPLRGQRDRW